MRTPRLKMLTCRLTCQELLALREAAAALGLDVSDLLRQRLSRDLRPRRRGRKRRDP